MSIRKDRGILSMEELNREAGNPKEEYEYWVVNSKTRALGPIILYLL